MLILIGVILVIICIGAFVTGVQENRADNATIEMNKRLKEKERREKYGEGLKGREKK